MLENINIDNFKSTSYVEGHECLKGLKSTDKLARINLIGGLNGIGKTALLNIIAKEPKYNRDFPSIVYFSSGFSCHSIITMMGQRVENVVLLRCKAKDNFESLKYSQELIQTLDSAYIILIDDIDTGLHYTAHESLWEFLITSAIKLNSQVFATTHNLEMITAFEKASRRLNTSKECCYIELSRHPITNIPILITQEMNVLRQDIDLLRYALEHENKIKLRGE